MSKSKMLLLPETYMAKVFYRFAGNKNYTVPYKNKPTNANLDAHLNLLWNKVQQGKLTLYVLSCLFTCGVFLSIISMGISSYYLILGITWGYKNTLILALMTTFVFIIGNFYKYFFVRNISKIICIASTANAMLVLLNHKNSHQWNKLPLYFSQAIDSIYVVNDIKNMKNKQLNPNMLP